MPRNINKQKLLASCAVLAILSALGNIYAAGAGHASTAQACYATVCAVLSVALWASTRD